MLYLKRFSDNVTWFVQEKEKNLYFPVPQGPIRSEIITIKSTSIELNGANAFRSGLHCQAPSSHSNRVLQHTVELATCTPIRGTRGEIRPNRNRKCKITANGGNVSDSRGLRLTSLLECNLQQLASLPQSERECSSWKLSPFSPSRSPPPPDESELREWSSPISGYIIAGIWVEGS